MRNTLLLSLCVASLAGGQAASRPAGPDTQPTTRPIPQVCSLEDLRRVEPIRVENWVVRMGWSEGGDPAPPWRLVWCLAQPSREDGRGEVAANLRGDPLGPVSLHVTTSLEDHLAGYGLLLAKVPRKDTFAEALYCQSFPADAKGKYYVNISSWAGDLLARQVLEVAKDQPRYWHAAVEARVEGEERYFRTAPRAMAAYPKFSGLQPVWELPRDRQVKELKEPEGKALRLPGLVPPTPLWRDPVPPQKPGAVGQKEVHDLALSLTDETLVLKPAIPIERHFLDFYLLARWWVSDRPVIAGPAKSLSMHALGRGGADDERINIRLVLPDSLGELKVGDKVAVQMLYSPGGWEPLGSDMTMSSLRFDQKARRPLLSNRLEFEVTGAMLKARSAAAAKPGDTIRISERAGDCLPAVLAERPINPCLRKTVWCPRISGRLCRTRACGSSASME